MIDKSAVVSGNVYDKYQSRNPIARFLMRRYFKAFDEMLEGQNPKRLVEIGCGEGEVLRRLRRRFPNAGSSGLDLSFAILQRSKADSDAAEYVCGSASQLPYRARQFDLVVCVEVLEHVPQPATVLRELGRIARGYLMVSVPNEPLWRALNVARGAYLTDLGNTPGHLHHWTFGQFKDLLTSHLRVVRLARPLPWSMALCHSGA